MARPLRIEYPGAFYHVASRGNAKGEIFLSRDDRFKFLSCLNSATERYGLRIHAYCLMGNHYHLIVETPRGNLSQAMHHVNTAYTISFNLRNNRVGHLFQGRYKSILVDSEAYALEVSRYIHLNPVRAEITNDPVGYLWSSLGAFTARRVAPDWLETDYVLSFFRGPLKRKKLAYRKFVLEGLNRSQRNPFEDTVASSILGRETFIGSIKNEHLAGHKDITEIPASKKLLTRTPVPGIVDAVQRVFGDKSRIRRQATLYFCYRYSGVKLKELGKYFQISSAAVSMSSRRFSRRIEKDEDLLSATRKVEKILNC